jgi:hypothetical protein
MQRLLNEGTAFKVKISLVVMKEKEKEEQKERRKEIQREDR